ISKEDAVNWGLSGPNLRGSGVDYDVRKHDPYSGYEKYDFAVPLGAEGSCWDRYFCRVREMRESIKIVEQAMAQLPEGPVMAAGVAKIPKPAPGESYAHVEASRGELGIYLASDGGQSPFRMHVRAPSFVNLAMLEERLVGMKIADVIAVLGSIDIVLGEVDR
ncbi:MAG: NADH-quinone oxidoreductase subunit D, partial [Proteobacteria bacterium]|nr:NADH-quinone oxidoreductase subunit D [Pseudomonadota bacterium]